MGFHQYFKLATRTLVSPLKRWTLRWEALLRPKQVQPRYPCTCYAHRHLFPIAGDRIWPKPFPSQRERRNLSCLFRKRQRRVQACICRAQVQVASIPQSHELTPVLVGAKHTFDFVLVSDDARRLGWAQFAPALLKEENRNLTTS